MWWWCGCVGVVPVVVGQGLRVRQWNKSKKSSFDSHMFWNHSVRLAMYSGSSGVLLVESVKPNTHMDTAQQTQTLG
jgi:hypothetical protein